MQSYPDPIYLDYAATTPLDKEVLAAMLPYLEHDFANPSSLHRFGQRARKGLETARLQVATALGCRPREIVFTGGATEADNHALRAVAARHPGGHIITSRLEHAAVLETARQLSAEGYDVTYLDPNERGEITPDALSAALKDNTALVALMYINNETGVVSDIPALSRLAHDAGALFFCDAVQAFGVLPVKVGELGADLLAVSGHKVYGPKGVGVLYVREGLELPLLFGGEQEGGLRAGTHNVPAIVGMGVAAALAEQRLGADAADIAALRDRLETQLVSIDGVTLNAVGAPRSPKHLNVSVAGVDGEALLVGLDTTGVAVSAGSACAAGSLEPSHVLVAMGLNRQQARSSVRLSLGRGVTAAMVDAAAQRFAEVVARCRAFAA